MASQSFTETEYADRSFTGVDAAGMEIMEARFDGCTFVECSFREAVLHGCRFSECRFENCDLTLVNLTNTVIVESVFEACQLIGVNWTLAAWDRASLLGKVRFERCALNYGTFIGLTIRELAMVHCSAKDVDFSEAVLHKADFTGTDFAEARFANTDLTEANFREARNYAINAAGNTLKGAKFQLPEALTLLHNLPIEIVD